MEAAFDRYERGIAELTADFEDATKKEITENA
jgi:hypothetical protein